MSHQLCILLLSIAFGMGFAALAYKDLAYANGWKIGEFYDGDASFIKILGFVAMISSAPLGWYVAGSWLGLIAVIIFGFMIGFFTTYAFRENAQLIIAILLPISWIILLLFCPFFS